MLLHTTKQSFQQYELSIESINGNFEMKVSVTKVNKPDTLQLENPQYKDLLSRCSHLAGVRMAEESEKPYLAVHLILGSGDFAR